MKGQELTSQKSTGATLDASVVQTLRERFRGPIHEPGEPGYNEARVIWNRMIERRPALIARCRGTADVIEAVNFARTHNLLVSIKGGGHNVSGTALGDGGVMIDLSLMRGIWVNPEARTVRVQGGAVWGEVDRETQLYGLAAPNGYVSTTGVAGFTLGGGYGALRRKYGLACDNLLSVEIVTADGALRRASETENPDLFWALRGGGGNFGVVTSFEFRCYPVGPMIFLCAPFYPIEQAREIIRSWRDFMATAPEDYTSNAVLWSIPDLPAFPAEARGRNVVLLPGLWAGAAEEGEKIAEPLRHLATPLMDLSGIVPYLAAQTSFDPFFPYGQRQNYWKAIHLNHLHDEVIDRLVDAAMARPSPLTLIPIWHFGGAISRVLPTDTAFWHRKVPFMVSFDAAWTDPVDAEKNINWARSSWNAMRPYSDGGVYVNFPGVEEDPETLIRAVYDANYDRLRRIKAKYDPTNLFRMNQNIQPAAD